MSLTNIDVGVARVLREELADVKADAPDAVMEHLLPEALAEWQRCFNAAREKTASPQHVGMLAAEALRSVRLWIRARLTAETPRA